MLLQLPLFAAPAFWVEQSLHHRLKLEASNEGVTLRVTQAKLHEGSTKLSPSSRMAQVEAFRHRSPHNDHRHILAQNRGRIAADTEKPLRFISNDVEGLFSRSIKTAPPSLDSSSLHIFSPVPRHQSLLQFIESPPATVLSSDPSIYQLQPFGQNALLQGPDRRRHCRRCSQRLSCSA
jgi:hypothetical protein